MFFLLPIGDDNPTEKFPFVNYALIIVNVVIFFIFGLRGDYEKIIRSHGLNPADIRLQAFITSAFLHGGVLHLFGNMLFLWIVGDNVEDRLGHIPYVLFYLAAGCASALPQLLAMGSSETTMIGASGAVSAAMGFYALLFWRVRVKIWYLLVFLFIRMGTFWMPAGVAMGLWFAGQLFYALVFPAGKGGGVAYWAHIGGTVFGVAVAFAYLKLFGRRMTRRRTPPRYYYPYGDREA